VDFELSGEQQELQSAAAALLDDRSSPTRVRAVSEAGDHMDAELWSALADQGWLAIERSEAAGGLGLGFVEVAVLCEQVGRHVAAVPYHGTLMTLAALDRAVADGDVDREAVLGRATVEEWTARLTAGDAVGSVAWSRRAGAVRAQPGGDGRWTLSGRADPAVYAPRADVVLVPAVSPPYDVVDGDGRSDGSRGAGAPSLFAVALEPDERPGVEPAMDRTRSLGWLELSERPALAVGGPAAADHLLDRAVTALCAEMLGAASRVLEMATAYAKDRVQFGQPIGAFQAVKHRCADMLVDVEGMRSSAYYAAWAVGAGDDDASCAASAAKVWCSDAGGRVMASGLQVHGGIGFTWEHDLHLYLKRTQLDQTSFGDAGVHRRRLVRLLRPRVEAGEPIL
jgi:alkylation response protein AidB-like acyl-CoA dehydrogenase